MFRGLHQHTIDLKGRINLPAKFRDFMAIQGEDKLIVTTSIDPCLVVYPVIEWQQFEDKLSRLPQFDPNVVKLKRIYVAAAAECVVDKQGRLLIPQELREYAGLAKDIIFAGMIQTCELWAKDRWQENAQQARAEASEVAKALGALGL